MAKTTVTRLFIGSLIAALAGAILVIVAVSIGLADGIFVMNGNRLVDIHWTAAAWAALGLSIAGGLTIIGAAIAGLVSWIGALLNTWQRPGKGWFVGLLLLGIFNFGFFAMIAYVIAGPDGSRSPTLSTAPAPAAA